MHRLQIPKSPISCNNTYEIQNHRSRSITPFSSSIKNCKGIGISVATKRPKPPIFIRGGGGGEERGRGPGKIVDVATLGNLCVDIVLNVPSLPPESVDEKKAYMERLADSRPDKVSLSGFLSVLLGLFDSRRKIVEFLFQLNITYWQMVSRATTLTLRLHTLVKPARTLSLAFSLLRILAPKANQHQSFPSHLPRSTLSFAFSRI